MFDPLPLAVEEKILWQGRPAPRAYTFRNWRHAVFGLVLMLPCLFWQIVGIELAATGAPAWVAWLPLPFNLGCLYLAFGQLLIARLEWEQVLYAVSDRTIYERRGFFRSQLRSLPLAAVTNVRQKRLGPNLATIRIDGEEGQTLHFSAIEHPELLLRLFPNVAAGHNSQKTT
ncbi:MAG: PH domain-containing protein [Deltaproteobacteria bacterium]|nr:MAG: PH domain-containing protein [Deltaproteobacteria bacterium]